jgi:penicillin amidase
MERAWRSTTSARRWPPPADAAPPIPRWMPRIRRVAAPGIVRVMRFDLGRWTRRLLTAGLGLLLLGAAALAAYLWRATPAHGGTLRLAGLQAEVSIERDAQGIPTIRGASLEDVAFGVGVAHAQDRLWQLETHRRIGSGRLAEAFGRSALETDRFLRALGVRRAAAAQWERIRAQGDSESRRVLEAYAAGVNAWQREHLGARPPEMLVLGVPVEDWTPVDSLAWALMMAWDLGGNWSTELLRARLALTLPVARIDELLPPYPGDKPLATADYAALFRGLRLGGALAQASVLSAARLDQLLAAAPPSGIEGVGSNNWVIAGTHTASGAPLLANDPHLKITAPALWYFARLEVTGARPLKVAGATMPGLPSVVLGQNEHIAWGFTNTGPDVQDLYLERFKPGDPMQVQVPGGPDSWAPLASVVETIRVKGAEDDQLVVRLSRHGPMISDAGGVTATVAGDLGIAMRWTALDADNDPVAAGLALARAKSASEFVDAATRLWVAPMQNMVVADREGRIAMVAPGRVPRRKPNHDLKGLAPAPGWDARYDWAGFVPAAETPREADPVRGFIASANQRVHARDYPHFITSEWAPPYRQHRIEQLLRAKAKHTIDDVAAMQADVTSLATQRLLPWLQRARTGHALAGAAREALSRFNGRMDADAVAPLIFWAWSRQLTRAVFIDELGGPEVYERVLGARTFRDALEGVLDRNDAWWCDDKATVGVAETCAALSDRAFGAALDELQARFGSDVGAWQWGRAHQARSEHRPFSRVKALAPLFELRVPTGGDTYTVNVGRVGVKADAGTGELYLNDHAASLRAIYDLGDPARSRVMHSSGQSGLPWSSRYRDFADAWARVTYVPLWPAANEAPAQVQRLQPRMP